MSLAAAVALLLAGCGSSSSSSGSTTAAPTFSPGGGSYNASQTVTVADTTSSAVLYCTTDGTTPTASSPTCAQPTTVFKTEFLQAIAVAPGKSPSPVASAGYTIDLAAAATPTFSPAGGAYTSTQAVTIADATAGANIFYTVDGTVPTAASTLYTGPVAVSSTETLSAIAVASGYNNSGAASAVYVINPTVAAPVFSVPAGSYSSVQSVGISDATSGATLYYTLDGTTPTTSSAVYSAPITIAQTSTLNAIAAAPGLANSPVVSASYVITLAPAPAPVFTPPAGAYTSVQSVAISDNAAGAVIYYTTDGSTPTTSSSVYSSAISVSTTEILNAIAIAPGYTASAVASAAYTVNLSATATPTFSPAAGTFTSPQTVTLSDVTPNATIYYTTDGSTPTTSSSAYSSPLTITSTQTLKAIATAPGFTPSPVASALYTISAGSSSLSGSVLSGASPVSSARVQLYAASTAGYGSPSTALLSAAVTTTSTGAFSFSYSCPAASTKGDLVYVVATGGDAGSGANTAIALMAALGPCGSLTGSPTVVVNETTTVAAAYALSPFITTAPGVGASAGNYQGLTNAFATVANLVDRTTGVVRTITPAYAANTVAYLNTSTVPRARIDTLADILNACVHSDGSGGGCSNLFSAATPTSGTAPADTLQAIVNIAQSPGANASTLFGLASPTGPFQPELTAAPTDWTLALTFTGAGLGISPTAGAMVTNSGSPFTIGIINTALAIDALGNVWVTAYEDNSPTFPAFTNSEGAFVAEFTNLGAPITPATTLDSSANATIGGYAPEGAATVALTALAFDQAGNAWLGDTQTGNVLKLSPSLSVLLAPTAALNQGVGAIAIDSSGNAWTGGIALSEFQPDGTPVLTSVSGNGAADALGYGKLGWLTFDSSGGFWGADTFSSESSSADLYQVDPATGVITYDAFPAGGTYATLAADGSGNVYGCATAGGQTLDVFAAGTLANSYSLASGRGCGSQLVLDGQGHLFAILNSAGFPAGAAIDEFTTAGVAISTPDGYTGTSASEPPTLNPDPNVYAPVPGPGAAIDGSGNLWVLNNDTNGAAASGNVLVEFIGIAAPVVTPTSLALQNGQLGARP